jgi:hypothetical protein
MAPGADGRDGHREADGEIALGPIPGRDDGHGRRRVGGRWRARAWCFRWPPQLWELYIIFNLFKLRPKFRL